MRYLIAESVALKPHLETAGELALRFRDEGHEVSFAWLGNDLLWSDWHLPWITRFLGCSLERRVMRFIQLLEQEKINTFDHVDSEFGRLVRALAWAANFHGDTDELKEYSLDSAALGMGAASSLISLHGDSLYSAKHHLGEVRECLTSAVTVYERARSVIKRVKPDVVITFNGRFATSKPIIAAAEEFGIRTIRHERGSNFQRYDIFEKSMHNFEYVRHRIKEHWATKSEEERKQNGHEFFQRRRCGDGIGWYSFTKQQDRGSIPARVRGMRRVVYFSSSDDEYAAVNDNFELGPWSDQLAAVKELIRSTKDITDLELIIRIHPHLTKKSPRERARWNALEGVNLKLIAAEEAIDSYALLDSADIVFSYGSTIGMEAAYWGKSSVLLAPCLYSDSPAVIYAKSETEIKVLLSSLDQIRPALRELCLPYGNYFMSYGQPFKYYKPVSLSEGSFLGDQLSWDSSVVQYLRKKGIGKLYRSLVKNRN
jgi:hypothetical protein